jgi:hypothetical protein
MDEGPASRQEALHAAPTTLVSEITMVRRHIKVVVGTEMGSVAVHTSMLPHLRRSVHDRVSMSCSTPPTFQR